MIEYIASEMLADWYDYLDDVYYRNPYHPYLQMLLDLLKLLGIVALIWVGMVCWLSL